MAVAYVGSAFGNDGTSTTLDPAFDIVVPVGASVGDLAIIMALSNNSGTWSLSGGAGGWTDEGQDTNGSNNISVQIWHKTLVSGDLGATITVSDSGSGGRFIGRMDVFSGASGIITAESSDTTADTAIVIPGVSVPDTDYLILTYTALRISAASAASITSWPTDFTPRGGLVNTATSSPNYSIDAATFVPTGSGTMGAGTATPSASSTDWVYSIAIEGSATAVTLSPGGIGTGQALGAPAISTTVSVAPTAISTGVALGAPAISATITQSPGGIASAAALGAPSLNLPTAQPQPTGIASGVVLGEPSITMGLNNLNPTGIASLAALGEPSISTGTTIAPDSIASAEALGAPEIMVTSLPYPDSILPDYDLIGAPSVSTQERYRVFRPPFVIHDHVIQGALRASLQYGLTIMQIDGEWLATEWPSFAQEQAADYFYRGGYDHEITDDDAEVLEAEGYEVSTEFRW